MGMVEDTDLKDLIIQVARRSHKSLQAGLQDSADRASSQYGFELLPWLWVEMSYFLLAIELYQAMPHWHYVSGRCLKPVPFELRMGALALWSSAWYYDICLRKARDRGNSRQAWENTEEWRKLLESTLDTIRQEIGTSRDLESERLFWRDYQKTRDSRLKRLWIRVRHWWNTLSWGH